MSWVISIVVVIAVLVVIIFLLGLAGKGLSSAKIANVCEKLLNANVDDRGFVIFEHKNRFIQYGIEVAHNIFEVFKLCIDFFAVVFPGYFKHIRMELLVVLEAHPTKISEFKNNFFFTVLRESLLYHSFPGQS